MANTRPNDIPWGGNYPKDAVQCDGCAGHGCVVCGNKGWLPVNHPRGKRCLWDRCGAPIAPPHWGVYCTSTCAFLDGNLDDYWGN